MGWPTTSDRSPPFSLFSLRQKLFDASTSRSQSMSGGISRPGKAHPPIPSPRRNGLLFAPEKYAIFDFSSNGAAAVLLDSPRSVGLGGGGGGALAFFPTGAAVGLGHSAQGAGWNMTRRGRKRVKW